MLGDNLESGTLVVLGYIRRNLHYSAPNEWAAGWRALYRRLSKSSVFLSEGELGMCSMLPVKKIDAILALVRPKSVVDIGCGTGQATAYFSDRAIETVGIEGSAIAIRRSVCPELIQRHDLRTALDLGSGLIDQSQKMTVAAMQMADMKVCAQRS